MEIPEMSCKYNIQYYKDLAVKNLKHGYKLAWLCCISLASSPACELRTWNITHILTHLLCAPVQSCFWYNYLLSVLVTSFKNELNSSTFYNLIPSISGTKFFTNNFSKNMVKNLLSPAHDRMAIRPPPPTQWIIWTILFIF